MSMFQLIGCIRHQQIQFQAIGEGALVGTSSAGKAVALTAGTDTTKYVVGTLLTESAADGNIVTAVVNCANPGRAA